ncbi:MAG: isochorismatase family protein [Gallicola sp.]|nr:isochorismatase family protein [Gallicola sp.]
MKTLIVIDCQNDFITGNLACLQAEEAVENIVKFINEEDVDVVYSCDWHSENNHSFEKNGGIWPVHCVENTWGAELSHKFKEIKYVDQSPIPGNIYKKGLKDEVEEYSAYYAENLKGEKIADIESEEYIVAGIASEFCVRETVLELLKKGKKVSVLKEALGYVNKEEHEKNLKDLEEKGAILK